MALGQALPTGWDGTALALTIQCRGERSDPGGSPRPPAPGRRPALRAAAGLQAEQTQDIVLHPRQNVGAVDSTGRPRCALNAARQPTRQQPAPSLHDRGLARLVRRSPQRLQRTVLAVGTPHAQPPAAVEPVRPDRSIPHRSRGKRDPGFDPTSKRTASVDEIAWPIRPGCIGGATMVRRPPEFPEIPC